jgi:hypothetical protein
MQIFDVEKFYPVCVCDCDGIEKHEKEHKFWSL